MNIISIILSFRKAVPVVLRLHQPRPLLNPDKNTLKIQIILKSE